MSRTLSLKPRAFHPAGENDSPGGSDEAGARSVLLQGIASLTSVAATYNRGAVILQPYVLFAEHDALFVQAVTVSRDGKPPREAKLGVFRLSGLSEVKLTTAAFAPQPQLLLDGGEEAGRQIIARVRSGRPRAVSAFR
jgi:hypothetical protein